VGPLVGTANLFSFGGISNRDNTAPPDTNASVGATQIIETVNTSYQVFTKTGVSLLGPRETSSIWSGFGGVCASGPAFGDPVVLYDKAAGRWLISQFASSDPFPHNTGTQCIAVSTSSDATGAYNRYAFSFSSFNDSTKFGVWPDAYYASYNMFTAVSFITEQVCAYDRSAMLAGTPAMTVCFQNSSDFAFLPSDLDGSTPPLAGEPNFFLELASSSSLKLFKFHVDFTTPSATFTGPIGIPVAPYSQACGGGTCIPQAGTSQQLDAKGDRLMHRLAYRNFGDHESLVVTHSVDAGSRVGVRWYEIRSPNGVPTVYQQGTYAPDSNYRWVGSIAIDGSGNIALGYSVSSSGMFPAIRFTGRVSSDPLGTMEAENVIIAGGGSQQGCPVDAQRWGDYTSMAIDPSDDATFVYANEYYRSTGCNWSTRIASFKITACRFHVYHLRTDQHVQELCGDGSTWQTQDLTTLTGALVAAAGSALSTFVDGAGGFHVYYLGTDLHVHELFVVNGAWNTTDDTAAAGAPNAAAGSALSSFVDRVGGFHVYYLGTDQHVHELFFVNGAWNTSDDTAAAGAPNAAAGSALSSFVDGAGGFHVYYLGTDQHVRELFFFNGAWNTTDNTVAAGAPNAAAGSALTSFVDGAGGFHVYYLGTDQHVHELFFFNGAWTTSDDTAAAGAPNAAAGSALTSFVP